MPDPIQWIIEANGSISFQLHQLPDQKIELLFPEWFTAGPERWNGSCTDFKTTPTTAVGSWQRESVAADLTLEYHQQLPEMRVDWKFNFHNHTDHPIHNLAAFNCVSLNHAPLFKDLAMDRTWVTNDQGGKVPLATIAKSQGGERRTMQFYPAVGGIDVAAAQGIIRYDVISPDSLAGDRVTVVSADAHHQIETIVRGPVAYFFNNWESDHGCIHAAPLFPPPSSPVNPPPLPAPSSSPS